MLLIVGIVSALPGSAKADCIYGQVEVRRWQQPNWTIVSPNDCVTDTPWAWNGRVYQAHYAEMPAPFEPGTPNGWQIGVYYPFP